MLDGSRQQAASGSGSAAGSVWFIRLGSYFFFFLSVFFFKSALASELGAVAHLRC